MPDLLRVPYKNRAFRNLMYLAIISVLNQPGVHSSSMQSGFVTGSLETSEILTIEFTRRNWVASNNDLPQLHGKIGNEK